MNQAFSKRRVYKSFEHFSSCLIDPMFEFFRIISKPDNKHYEDLISDLNELDDFTISKHRVNSDFYAELNPNPDKATLLRYFTLIFELRELIKLVRYEYLFSNNQSILFKSTDLSVNEIDKYNLVSTINLKTESNYFENNGKYLRICPTLGDVNSSYWLSKTIISIIQRNRVKFQVRLDPLICIPLDEVSIPEYKMLVHGIELNWGRIKKLDNNEFGEFQNEGYSKITQYNWSPTNNEVTFSCEEFPIITDDIATTSRYFHAILDKTSGQIKHCDGAIRFYNSYEINERRSYKLWKSEATKIGRRIKIFQYDAVQNGGRELKLSDFERLVRTFFVWNEDVENYFSKL
jgi:hypothetical protein